MIFYSKEAILSRGTKASCIPCLCLFCLGNYYFTFSLAYLLAECEKLMDLYERLEELDANKAEMRASRILHGLGFTTAMQRKKLKDFSGGWRMRVALAR